MKKNLSSTYHSIGTLLVVLILALCPGGAALAQGNQKDQPAGEAMLTSQEALKMVEALKKLANKSTEGLVQVRHPDGSISMDLQGRFQSVTLAKKEADGSISQTCVDNAKSAAAFLGIDPKLVESGKADSGSPGQTQAKKQKDR